MLSVNNMADHWNSPLSGISKTALSEIPGTILAEIRNKSPYAFSPVRRDRESLILIELKERKLKAHPHGTKNELQKWEKR